MPEVWITANPILGSREAAREMGFPTAEDMAKALREDWSNSVSRGELIFVCGSVGNPEEFELFMQRLPGRKVRVTGYEPVYNPSFWFDVQDTFETFVSGPWGDQCFGAGKKAQERTELVWDGSEDSEHQINVSAFTEGRGVYPLTQLAQLWASLKEGSILK